MHLLRFTFNETPRRLAETLLIAAIGGAVFQFLKLPAGLVSGSVLAVAIAALVGRPMMVPAHLTRLVLILIGIALGSVVSPETLKGLTAYPASIAILALATLSMTAGAATYLRLIHGWDTLSALLGSSPGGLSQVIALAADQGVDTRAIAVVQTTRIILLTVGLPVGLALLGFSHSTGNMGEEIATSDPVELAVLLAVSTIPAFALFRVGFPGAWLFGAMVGSAVLHGSGLIQARLPLWVLNTAMVTLGAVTGSRFFGTTFRKALSLMAAALGSIAVSVTISGIFALATTLLLPVRPAEAMIAFAPGAQETMMLLALALHLDPIFIGIHHLARSLIISLTIPPIAGLIIHRAQRNRA
jgi:uncharacterized protein